MEGDMDRCLIYRHGARRGDRVALTFDDGPNPPRTEQILEILRRADAKATFFVIGRWAERFPETIRRILADGHLIGNHSYSARMHAGDYDEGEAVIGHVTGRPTRYFRAHGFDYGSYFQSLVSRLPDSYVIDADVNPSDYALTDPDEITRRVLQHPELGPGSIINLHDGGEMNDAAIRLQRALPVIQALPRILDGLAERGLQSVSLNEIQLAKPIEWTAPRTTSENRRICMTSRGQQ
jgi:peptidoglycan/xylan/chitin deacetylase (PgdA/CDA1 family)